MYKNQVILEGFLGADVVIRFTPSGEAVGNARLATKEVWSDKQGERQEHTEWHALVFYGQRAEHAEHYLKGDNIHLEGKIHTRKFKDKDDIERTAREIIVMRSHRIDRLPLAESGEDEGDETGAAGDGANAVAAEQNWPEVR